MVQVPSSWHRVDIHVCVDSHWLPSHSQVTSFTPFNTSPPLVSQRSPPSKTPCKRDSSTTQSLRLYPCLIRAPSSPYPPYPSSQIHRRSPSRALCSAGYQPRLLGKTKKRASTIFCRTVRALRFSVVSHTLTLPPFFAQPVSYLSSTRRYRADSQRLSMISRPRARCN